MVGLVAALSLLVFMVLRWQVRTKPENVAKHPARMNLLKQLFVRPGSTIRSLADETHLNAETARYHLHVLERAGIIHGEVRGRQHHYYPPGDPRELREAIGTVRRGWSLELVRSVLERPGIRQVELTRELGIGRKMLRISVGELARAGLIEERREGGARRYYATAKLEAIRERVPEWAGDRSGADLRQSSKTGNQTFPTPRENV